MKASVILQWLLPFIGVALAVATLLANFGTTLDKVKAGDTTTLVLILITLLCGAYGAERLATTHQLTKRLDSIDGSVNALQGLVAHSAGGQFLNGRDAIYKAADRACQRAEDRIRVFMLGARPSTPDYVTETIARRLRDGEVRYDAVYMLAPGQLSEFTTELAADILPKLQQYGVMDRCSMHVLETSHPVCFDVLIVDRRHVGIGFTRAEKTDDLQTAVMFENQDELASRFVDWFDRVLKPNTVPLDASPILPGRGTNAQVIANDPASHKRS